MTVKDFVEQRKKLAGKDKALQEIEELLKSFDKDTQKKVLTPFGTEIHSSESVISTKTRPLTLCDRMQELELLSQRVMERKVLEATLSDMMAEDDDDEEDLDEIEEDLSFDSKEHIVEDENGDKSIQLKDEDDGEGDGEQGATPQS